MAQVLEQVDMLEQVEPFGGHSEGFRGGMLHSFATLEVVV
jgi:hypothetical protein